MAEPTARPWRTDPEFGHEVVLGADGIMVADCCILSLNLPATNVTNAALIVRAVNAHDDLVEMVRLLERSIVYEMKKAKGDGDDEGQRLKATTLAMVRAALAKAGA